jgi:hypothetical protein
MVGVSGNSDDCSLPLYRTQTLNLAMFADGGTRVAARRGTSPVRDLGFRRLIPSLEQVTFNVPTVTPIRVAISSQLVPRATRSLICWTRSGVNLLGRCDIAQLPVLSQRCFVDGTRSKYRLTCVAPERVTVQGVFASHSVQPRKQACDAAVHGTARGRAPTQPSLSAGDKKPRAGERAGALVCSGLRNGVTEDEAAVQSFASLGANDRCAVCCRYAPLSCSSRYRRAVVIRGRKVRLVPRGQAGPPGPVGPAGPQGAQGPQGPGGRLRGRRARLAHKAQRDPRVNAAHPDRKGRLAQLVLSAQKAIRDRRPPFASSLERTA